MNRFLCFVVVSIDGVRGVQKLDWRLAPLLVDDDDDRDRHVIVS